MPLLATLFLARPLAADQATRLDGSLAGRVEAAILSSPRYGPFDVISFEVAGDTVRLGGDVYRPILKEVAARAVEAVPGVAHVVNSIEILPPSFVDDRRRRAVFATIYRDNFLAKYGTPATALGLGLPGRGRGVRAAGVDRALGLEPPGNYAIHVVVKRGRVTLYGNVDNAVDREKATFDTRSVFGVMGVENRIELIGRAPAA